MPAKHPATDSTSTPESRSARLKRLADENLADELTIEPARKSIKAREAEMLALLQTKEPENAKAAEHENRHLGTESVDEFQDNRRRAVFFKLLQTFKNAPRFDDQVICRSCLEEDPDQPILASCLHVFCTSCFKLMIDDCNVERDHNRNLTIVSCYEKHLGPNKELICKTQIDGYAELNDEELLQLERMLDGEDVDIREMAALHKPKPDKQVRNQWQKLLSRRK